MLYLADVVLPMSSPPLIHGAVRVEGPEIVAVGPASELRAQPGEAVRDLGASTLLPGWETKFFYDGGHPYLTAKAELSFRTP